MVAFAHEFKSARAPSGEKPQYPGFCDKVIASDHLGSVEAVTDAQGNVLEQLSYNAWGQRRNANWTAGTPARSTSVNRGYTDHEMLDGVGLVHMNGRVYDPVLARFLRSDPVVSDPLSAQTYNGYSYVGNNPLGAIDPSGYDGESWAFSAGNVTDFYSGNTHFTLDTSPRSGSGGFSLFGGTVTFSLGGGDPFNSRWGPAYPIGPLMQAQYTSLFGAPSIFRGGQTVADGNSYIRSAGSSAKGDSTIRTVYGPLTGQNLVRLLGFDGMIWEDIRNSPLTQKEAARILMVLGHRIPETHEIFAAKLAIYQFYSPRGALAIKGTIAGGMWLATTVDTAIQVGTSIKPSIPAGSFAPKIYAAEPMMVQGQKLLTYSERLADHHIFPQTFRKWFESRGIANIDDFTVTVDHYVTHLRGIHGAGNLGQMPGRWNARWLEFKTANPNASAQEIFQFAGKLMDEFGINHLPIHPYGK